MSAFSRFTDGLSAFLTLRPVDWDIQTRTAAPFTVGPPFDTAIRANPWRAPSVRQALGVPAILRCVTLISNTAGALSMRGIRNGSEVMPEDRPPLIVRPSPLTTPQAFWSESTYWKALYGEQWWWVAKRDGDGYAMSLVPVPPYEVRVEPDPGDNRYPIVFWRNVRMPRGDMILNKLMPDPDAPARGVGPLQLCGGAVSAAVEAQEWAANFYADGGFPSIWVKPEVPFESEDEATKFKQKWGATPSNTPRVLEGIDEVGSIPVNEQGAQMLQARAHSFGEAALMFGIPGSMVEFAQSGSSLTYQNVGQRFDDFIKTCLWPNYLEGAEQSISDLLPRSWTAEFDTDRFTRPDPKTRAEIHATNIASGVYDVARAQRMEGIVAGSIETAPVPQSPPQALPPIIEFRSAPPAVELRCDGMRTVRRSGVSRLAVCGKLLSETGVFVGRCPRCHKEYGAVAA